MPPRRPPTFLCAPTDRPDSHPATRVMRKLHATVAGAYAALVPEGHAVCTVCIVKNTLTSMPNTARAREKHFAQHTDADALASDGEAREFMGKQLAAKQEKHAEAEANTLVVAVVHDDGPYRVLELRRPGADEITAVTAAGPITVPDLPHMAKLRGKPLVAADSILPALVRALEKTTTFWPWFTTMAEAQRQRPPEDTRLYTGTWMSIVDVVDNHHTHAPTPETKEVLKMIKRVTAQPDAGMRVIELYGAAHNGLRWKDGAFHMQPKTYGFATPVAQDAECAVFGVLVAATLSEHDVLCALVHRDAASKAQVFVDDPASVLKDLQKVFEPAVAVPGDFWSAEDEVETWLKFCVDDSATWDQLRPTFPRIAHMASAALLLGGPSAYAQAQMKRAAEHRGQPALYEEAVTGRKRPAPAPIEPEAKRVDIDDTAPKEDDDDVEPVAKRVESEPPEKDDDSSSADDESEDEEGK